MDKSENASVLSRLGDPTFHAILWSTADLSENNFSFEWSKDDEAELNYASVTLGEFVESIALKTPRFLLTVHVDNTGAVADQTVR